MPKKYKGRNLSVFIDVQLYSQHSTTAIMAGLSNLLKKKESKHKSFLTHKKWSMYSPHN